MFGGNSGDKPTTQDMYDQFKLMDKSTKENIQPPSENKPKKEVKFDDSKMKSLDNKKRSSKNMPKSQRKELVTKITKSEREVLSEKKVVPDKQVPAEMSLPSFTEQDKSLSVIDEKTDDNTSLFDLPKNINVPDLFKKIFDNLTPDEQQDISRHMGLIGSDNSEAKDYSKIIESSKLENQKLQNSNKQQSQFISNLEAKIKDLQIAHNEVEI